MSNNEFEILRSRYHKQKVRFSVSVTPVVELDKEDDKHAPMSVLHEQIRKSVGGGGVIETSSLVVGGTFVDGNSTPVTSNATSISVDGNEEIIFIKHTGFLIDGTTKAADSDTLIIKVTLGTALIAELLPGEGMVFPRPGGNGD